MKILGTLGRWIIVCSKCNCVFKYSKKDIQNTDYGGRIVSSYVMCPRCKKPAQVKRI